MTRIGSQSRTPRDQVASRRRRRAPLRRRMYAGDGSGSGTLDRDVGQDLRRHQRGGRPAGRRARCRRARIQLRAGKSAPGGTRDGGRDPPPPPAGVVTVGVFRDETKERVVELVNTLGLGGAQLHGREPLSDVRWIRRRVPVRHPGRSPPATPRSPRSATVRSTSCWSTPTSPVRASCSTGRWPTPCPPGCGSCSPAASTARTSRRRSGACGRGASTSRPGSRPRRARAARTPASSGASSTQAREAGDAARGRRLGARPRRRAV